VYTYVHWYTPPKYPDSDCNKDFSFRFYRTGLNKYVVVEPGHKKYKRKIELKITKKKLKVKVKIKSLSNPMWCVIKKSPIFSFVYRDAFNTK